MSDIITIPTVEQINLEHRLANSKASEAVQHATNCGLMLLQVKANLNHGEWLPWLNGEIESGRLQISVRHAQRYTKLAANTTRASYLAEAPSIRAALELLSDKDPEEQQGSLVDIEAERQAREAAEVQAEAERQARLQAEQDREEWEVRQKESQAEANERRKKIRELEQQVDLLKAEKPEVRIEAPADYEATKERAEKMAERIQARAIRRCGELLKQIESGQGKSNQYTVLHDATDMKQTRTEAATQAGLSERQKVTALRVANVPAYAVCLPAAYACHRHLHR